MLHDETLTRTFAAFVEDAGARLQDALGAMFGAQAGRDAAADALAYGWEHWERISGIENPGGSLYRVGYDRARRMRPKRLRLPAVDATRQPWVEPGLPSALAEPP